ncbi:MAG: hypothetical protein AB1626_01405 [Candidatus Micrarchaeota archaeon]
MLRKGMFFTYDALAALVVVSAAAAMVLAFSNYNPVARGYAGLDAVGRDYLTEKYQAGITITEADVLQLTGKNVSETLPADEPLVAHSVAFDYLDLCNCTDWNCSFFDGVNESCFFSQDINESIRKEAWVTP